MTLHTPTPESACICPRCRPPLTEAQERELAARIEWLRRLREGLREYLSTPEPPPPPPSRWRRLRSWLAQQWLECWR